MAKIKTLLEEFIDHDTYMDHETHTELRTDCSSCFALKKICKHCPRILLTNTSKETGICGPCRGDMINTNTTPEYGRYADLKVTTKPKERI